jgi:hypothetical protein
VLRKRSEKGAAAAHIEIFLPQIYSAKRMQAQPQLGTERRWAIVRLVLGLLQIVGARFSLALLVEAGVNRLSLASVAVSGLLTTLSVLLFGKGSWIGKNKTEGGNNRGQS